MVAAVRRYVVAAVSMGVLFGVVVLAQSDVDRDRAKDGVVMIRTQLPGGSAIGAGLIVAVTPRDIYVATANHLLRRGGTASSIQLQFASRPGEWFDARLLDLRDVDLDLAAVVVPLPPSLNAAALKVIAAAPASQLRRGADVYPLGFPRERPWNMPVAADKVATTSTLRIIFQSQYVQPGNSGGALLDACGRIVGMVTATDPPEAEAVRIESIVDAVKTWNLPVPLSLTLATATCGGAPVRAGPARPDTALAQTDTIPTRSDPPPATCDVTLSSTPSTAEVYLDETRSGSTPRVVTLKRGQRYDLRVEKDGFRPFERQIDCATNAVRAALEAETTSIDLNYGGDLYACVLQLQVKIGPTTANPTSNPYSMRDVPLGRQNYTIGGQIGCPYTGVCAARGQGTINVDEGSAFNILWSNTAIGQCQVSLVGR